MSEPKRRTIAMDVPPDSESPGIVWTQTGGGRKDRIPAKLIGEVVCSYIEELADGEDVEIVFSRRDMTKAEIKAIPEA